MIFYDEEKTIERASTKFLLPSQHPSTVSRQQKKQALESWK
jgi:hypothetical protein